ncbi:MAG: AI-2E family transporter [Bdellovibrionales bacterium]|nr:AI-2E family transporter [Bdellovibrionales bacterium]
MLNSQALKRDRYIKMLAFLGILIFFGWVILKVENMLVSTLLASVLAYLMGPLVNAIERTGLKRHLAIVTSFVIVGFFLALGITFAAPLISGQLSNFQSDLPKYVEGSARIIRDIESKINSYIVIGDQFDLSSHAQQMIIAVTKSIFEDLPAIISKSVTTILLAPFFTYFLLRDGQSFVRKLLRIVPNSIFELTLSLHHEINDQMGQFVRARLFEALIVGIIVWIGLFALGFPYASVLASFAALANLIPYIGPIIGGVPAVGIAMINGNSSTEILIVILIYGLAQLIDIVFIIPLVVAKIVNLHPITVLVVIIIGAQLMGVTGMLISIPVASALKVTLYSVYQHLTDFRTT